MLEILWIIAPAWRWKRKDEHLLKIKKHWGYCRWLKAGNVHPARTRQLQTYEHGNRKFMYKIAIRLYPDDTFGRNYIFPVYCIPDKRQEYSWAYRRKQLEDKSAVAIIATNMVTLKIDVYMYIHIIYICIKELHSPFFSLYHSKTWLVGT